MNQCRYSQKLGCKTCDYTYFVQCKKFVTAHAAFLADPIRPFKVVPVSCKDRVCWSRDINKAKSMALRYALSCNHQIVKYTLSQVLSLVIESSELSDGVYFIDISQKPMGDMEKVKSCLCSFVDKQLLLNSFVVIFSNIPLTFDYTKL